MLPVLERYLAEKTIICPNGLFSKLIPPDYLYKKKCFRYVTREGINYKLDISNVVDHYLYFGIKDSSYNSIIDVIKEAKVILDIGANIGRTALFFASNNPAAKIIAFEPHPDTFERANENLNRNNFNNISVHNIGLGETKTTLKLYEVNENNPGMNRIIDDEIEFPYKPIIVKSLDSFISENNISEIDFIKIDVEGFEYAVLKGGFNLISRNRPVLFIELDDNNLKANKRSAKELIQLLIKFGYNNIYRADDLMPITSEKTFDNCHYDIIAKN